MSFELNQGQTDKSIKFLSRGRGYGVYLMSTEAVLILSKTPEKNEPHRKTPSGAVLRLRFKGANPAPDVTGVDELPGKTNYFLGNDRHQWQTNIPTYGKVEYHNLYSGIDLVYYGHGSELEYDLVVTPGADPNRIRLGFDETQRVSLDEDGNLLLQVEGEEIRLLKPIVYQQISGKKQDISGQYVLVGEREIGLRIGEYDGREPLVIDPVLSYSTYLGGNAGDWGNAISVDAQGNVYVTGYTTSTDFPTANPFQRMNGSTEDVFVTKLNPAGSALLYSTYLGGSGTDEGLAIAVDTSGNAHVTGFTESANFPTADPLQSTKNGTRNAFVSKLNAEGSTLIYSTYLGGGIDDAGRGIAVDASGNTYVTGLTSSGNFPTADPLQSMNNGRQDVFVSKLNTTGSMLLYSTYVGGSSNDGGTSIAVDESGNAYVTGYTSSTNFPIATPLQGTYNGGQDAFVIKLNTAGSVFLYSTYLGGSSVDQASGIAVDALGNAYVTGSTVSTNFPTVNPLQPTALSYDAFVSKLNPSGSALLYSTYLGGSGDDRAFGIAVDVSGNAFVTGRTSSTDFPTANPIQPRNGGANGTMDAFVSVLSTRGSSLYSTYIGGSGDDYGAGIAVDPSGDAYVTGFTLSTNFPTADPVQPGKAGSYDAFIAKIINASNSTPFVVSNLGGVSMTSSGSGTPVRTGYARIEPAAGSPQPSGVAIFGFRANNILVSETGVPAASLLRSGRIYADVNSPVDTGLAIANPNNTAVQFNFFFTDTAGNSRGAGNLVIPANAQIAKFLDQSPFNAPAPFLGAFSFQSDQPVGVIALRGLTNERGEFLMSTLPVIDTSAIQPTGTQVVPHYADGQGWTTQILLVNPTEGAITGNLQFSNPDGSAANITVAGQTQATFAYAIPARSSQRLTTSGASAVVRTGSVRVVPSTGVAPTPLVIFSYTISGVTVAEAGVPVTSGTALRMYAESSFTSGRAGDVQSGVAVANLSSSAATVTFEVTGLDGRSAANPVSISLAASGQASKLLNELFPFLPVMPNRFKGVLRITANAPGVSVVGLRIDYNERNEALITTTPPSVETNQPVTPMLFPHFADGGGYTTQFILFSGTAGQSPSGNLNVYDSNGQPLNLGLH